MKATHAFERNKNEKKLIDKTNHEKIGSHTRHTM